MADASPQIPPVREALDDVVGTSRTILMQRLDLLQLEAERLVDDAATRVSEASVAIVLGTLSLLAGTVALIAWGEPHFGLAGSSSVVSTVYGLTSMMLARAAKRRRSAHRGSKGRS